MCAEEIVQGVRVLVFVLENELSAHCTVDFEVIFFYRILEAKETVYGEHLQVRGGQSIYLICKCPAWIRCDVPSEAP